MRTIIIEDENAAARRLKKLLEEQEESIEVTKILDSIESSIEYFSSRPNYDFVLMEIHLADGSSFEIFNHVEIQKPIIFVTAYDEYAIQAFRVNAVDYLLKPIKKRDLEAAILKIKKSNDSLFDYDKIAHAVLKDEYNKRFLIKIGQQMKVVSMNDAAYFYTKDKITFLISKDGKRLPIDFSLDKIEGFANPKIFFRINRQFIISIDAIHEMIAYSKSRVKLSLNPPCDLETVVSTERSPVFKKWLVGDA